MKDLHHHRRVNDILLGPLERPALKWLAAHLPAWMTPDLCTVIGVIGALVVLIGYALTRISPNFLWLASLGYVVNWFGDSLDGTLARHRRIERPLYGFFVDHTVDAFTEAMILLGLGLTPYIRFDLACMFLCAYLLLSVLVLVRTCVAGEFRISFGKFGPTEVRALAILLNVVMYFAGTRAMAVTLGAVGRFTVSPYDLVFIASILIMLAMFIASLLREAFRLAKANE